MGVEAFGVLLGGILWHTTLTWGPHSPGFEENLDEDNDVVQFDQIMARMATSTGIVIGKND